MQGNVHMTDSTENATLQRSTEADISDSSIQIQIGPNFQFKNALRDIGESEFLDSVDLEGVAFSVESVISPFSGVGNDYRVAGWII